MKASRAKLILSYVLPTILSQCAFFLFTIVDGIFVGRGVGTDALGAVNLAQPLVMVIGAVFMLTTIGGVTITAIRMGRKDYEGANQSFLHAAAATLVVAAFFTVIGTVFTKPLAILLGASGVYVEMVCDYLFWYTAFTIPSALAATLQGFGRNDGAPVFVMVSTIVSTALNIFLDWLFVFPLKQGLAGADHRVLHEPCDHPVSAGGQRQRLLGHQLCGRLCLCRVYRCVRGDAAAVRAELRR